MKNLVIGRIYDLYFSLSASERKVADLVMQNPQKFVHMTSVEISKAAKVSEPTVFRMCKSLGYNGLQDFRLVLASTVEAPPVQENKETEQTEEADNIAFLRTNFTSLFAASEITYKMLDFSLLEQVAEMIGRAGKICFFGVGASYLVCLDAQRKMLRLNVNAFAFDSASDVNTVVNQMQENDVLFVISYSGTTQSAQEVISIGEMKGINTILLTSYPSSLCAKHAKVILRMYAAENLYIRSGIASRYSQLIVVDALYMLMCKRDPVLQAALLNTKNDKQL